MDNYINKFGSFQNNVGKATTSMSLVIAYIVGGILILIGLACIGMGFTPIDSSTNFSCKTNNDCDIFDEKCNNNKCSKPPQRHYIIGIIAGLIFIIIAIIIIVLSKTSSNLANNNRGYAQLAGVAAEANIVKNLFN